MPNIKPETLAANGGKMPDNGKRYNVDYKAIHDEYVEGDITVNMLAAKYGIPYATLKGRMWREHWSDHRSAYRLEHYGATYDNVVRVSRKEIAEIGPQDEKSNKKTLDETNSIAIQKLAVFMREASTAAELNKLIKSLIDLRESDTMTNIERTQLTIDIPDEYSE